jgi:hypothetical protein
MLTWSLPNNDYNVVVVLTLSIYCILQTIGHSLVS